MNKELAKTLTLALVNYLDENRPEGTMDCSSGECVSLEKAFTEENFDSVETLINKKLSRLTEFELRLLDWLSIDTSGEISMEKMTKVVKNRAAILLAIAKKELLSEKMLIEQTYNPDINKDHELGRKEGIMLGKAEALKDIERTYFTNPEKLPKWLKDDIARKELNAHTKGYNKGYKDAEKRYNESVAYHFPTMPTTPVFGCDGIHCTNPQMDCINCPRANVVINQNHSTSSCTSAATLHGNTSATDSKEHNPSFTD